MSADSNRFGKLFSWTSFGESHGTAMGVVIDGCPSGVAYDEALLLENMAARRPGQAGTSTRSEKDHPEILSGIFENQTLGTPIAIMVRNTDQKSKDYDAIKINPRRGHADETWSNKFGLRDYRGGGRASARETLNWVIAGSFAEMFLRDAKDLVSVESHLTQVGGSLVTGLNDPKLVNLIDEARDQGDSLGAVLEVRIKNPTSGLGEPVFAKLKSTLANAYFGINACCGVELGGGFSLATMKGSQVHRQSDSSVYGGILGGITTGEDIVFRLAFKPTASIGEVANQGRHDPCVALRALPIARALSFCVLADFKLMKRLNCLES